MKIEELFPKEGKNLKKAKKIRRRKLSKAKDNNPELGVDRADWGETPYQGTFDRMRMGVS